MLESWPEVLQSWSPTVIAAGVITGGIGLAWKRIVSPTHKRIERLWELTEHELQPNDGKSMKDQVGMLLAQQAKTLRRLDDLEERDRVVAEELLAEKERSA